MIERNNKQAILLERIAIAMETQNVILNEISATLAGLYRTQKP